jgi:ATP-dependent DNA helicase RecG
MNTGVSIQATPHKKQLSLRQEEILNLLKQKDFMSAKEILQNLEEPPAPRTLRDDFMYLKQAGLINFEGHAKKAVWFIIK